MSGVAAMLVMAVVSTACAEGNNELVVLIQRCAVPRAETSGAACCVAARVEMRSARRLMARSSSALAAPSSGQHALPPDTRHPARPPLHA